MEAKLYSEILADFDNAPTRANKIAVLQKHDHPRFRSFLAMVYNPEFIFQVEIPTYRPAIEPAGLNYTYLDIEVPKLYRFIPGHPKLEGAVLDEKRKKSLLTSTLESLHKDEAELLVKTMKKDLGIKFLTPKLLKEAYTDLNI